MASEATALTAKEVLSIAKNKWNFDLKLVNFKLTSYSNERLGFLSLHQTLILEIEETATKVRHSCKFFVKCLPPKEDTLAQCMTDMGVFAREIAFYSDIIPALQVNFKEESWSPMCYGITSNAMILEDLRIRNFALSTSKIFSYDEMKSLLSAIARMQCASIIAEKRLGKPLNEVFPGAFDMTSILKPNGFFRKWYQTAVNLGIRLAKQLGLKHEKIQTTCDRLFELSLPAKGQQNVVAHGDLWSNNIMFDNRSPQVCTLIDFQWTKYVPPLQDVVLVLHYCNTKEFRHKYMDELLNFHYNEMKRIFERHDVEAFTWEHFIDTMEDQNVMAKIFMVLCFPSIFMDGDVCAEMMKDESRFLEFMFSDKGPMTMSLLSHGGEYEEKVTQAVVDLVELSESLN